MHNETHKVITLFETKKYVYIFGGNYGEETCNVNDIRWIWNYDRLVANYPHSQLQASGMFVGLPDGQMGNSEVGHLNIGAGRIIYQELTRITKEINEGGFFKNEALLKAMENAKKDNSALHLMGLLSNGGVHSHIDHLKGLLKLAKEQEIKNVYVHCFIQVQEKIS